MDNRAFKKVISRRSLLKGAPLAAATAVSLGCLTPGEVSAQQLKMSKALSKYQDTPKNGQHCSTCSHFVGPASCAVVVNPIVPQGWCQFYVAKP